MLPKPHRVAALLNRWPTGTHQGAVQASHIDYYRDAFTFRLTGGNRTVVVSFFKD